jgi:hypothetical protein
MNAILLLASLATQAHAQTTAESDYHVSYESGSKTHRVCGTPDNTNALIRLQDIGEIEARATLHWKTSTVEAVAVQLDEVEGRGQSPLWDKFYSGSLSRSQRIEVLKDAIQGIGDATAALVYPYFYGDGIRKARTWKDFAARIREAGNDIEFRSCVRKEKGMDHCIRASSWVPKVLSQYATENRVNLGYSREQITGVRVITRTEEHSRRAPERDRTLRYAIRFSGFKLLPGECDSVTVTYSDQGIGNAIKSSHNQATASHVSERASAGRDALILVTAQGRRAVGAPAGLVQLSTRENGISIQKSTDLAAFGVNREFVVSCRLNATVAITAFEKKSWYDWGGKSRSLGSRTFTVSANPAVQHESIGAVEYNPQTEQLSLQTSLAFAPGCPFFNDRPL